VVPAPPRVTLGRCAREVQAPVVSLALGEARAAALSDEPWIHERGAWRRIPIPEKLRIHADRGDTARIFFGRDDRPRLMGTRRRDGAPSILYLRFRNDQWREEPNELAKLRNPPAQGLWGVLGHADPEVVCKIDDGCIIKRRSGWKQMPAGSLSPRVELHHGVAWALRAGHVERLDEDRRWTDIGAPAPFREPGGVWAQGDEVWVSEPATGRLHRWDGKSWSSEQAPVSEPRGFWGSSPRDLWLAGAEGLARHDGQRWSLVEGTAGPLQEVHGRGREVWAAGSAGVWVCKDLPPVASEPAPAARSR
jgi:hypothetical protein